MFDKKAKRGLASDPDNAQVYELVSSLMFHQITHFVSIDLYAGDKLVKIPQVLHNNFKKVLFIDLSLPALLQF